MFSERQFCVLFSLESIFKHELSKDYGIFTKSVSWVNYALPLALERIECRRHNSIPVLTWDPDHGSLTSYC